MNGPFCLAVLKYKGKSMALKIQPRRKLPSSWQHTLPSAKVIFQPTLTHVCRANPLPPYPQAKSKCGAVHTTFSQPRIDQDGLGLPLERSQAPRSPPPNPAPSNHSDSLAAAAVASTSAEAYGNVKVKPAATSPTGHQSRRATKTAAFIWW